MASWALADGDTGHNDVFDCRVDCACAELIRRCVLVEKIASWMNFRKVSECHSR